MAEDVEELEKRFLARHWEWRAVNNPAGFASGQVWQAWNARTEALLALVAATYPMPPPS